MVERLRQLELQSRSIPTAIEGRFSLGGAQVKDALHFKDGEWFVPEGRIPSTHILKPQLDDFEDHALNELFCLNLARHAGLPAPACPRRPAKSSASTTNPSCPSNATIGT